MSQLPHHLEYILDCHFNNAQLFIQAVTHPSYTHESAQDTGDYQRLEFLGDSVLSLLLAELIYTRYPDWQEGDLSRLRARLAGQDLLADRARSLKLGELIYLGRGEEQTSGRTKDSILADVLEALIGALYLDQGLAAARKLVVKLFSELVETPGTLTLGKDSKSELQELLSSKGRGVPEYVLSGEHGPPHDRQFTFQLFVAGKLLATGEGRSKKSAQQAAAATALLLLGTDCQEDT